MINTKIIFTIKTDKTGNVNISYRHKDLKNTKTEQEENFIKYVEMLINSTLEYGLGGKNGGNSKKQ